VLEGDPVKTVVAQECVHQNENNTYTAQKSKEKKVWSDLIFYSVAK
jgi:NEDD4-binding protein 2